MRIKKIISQTRRDFRALYECESCGCQEESRGYDDDFYHKNVIPNKECRRCGKKSPKDYKPLKPKYSPDVII